MNRWIRSRNNQVILGVMVLMAVLGIRLFFLTIVQGERWTASAANLTTKSIYTVAPRGQILDRYGRLLAGNRATFAVQFDATDLKDDVINRQAQQLIALFEANGDVYVDNLPIRINADGSMYYTYQQTIEEWLRSENMPVTFTAEEAFAEIRARNNIDEELDKYEAQAELQTKYNIYPPISVKNMQYREDLEKEGFLGRYSMKFSKLKEFLTPEEIAVLEEAGASNAYTLNFESVKTHLSAERVFRILREKFAIDPALSDTEARKIMVVRNEIAALGYSSYIPAKIAKDVCETTIINLEERSSDFIGVDVAAESQRIYPNGSTASHILGYLGQISETEKEDYVTNKGYRPTDMIGKTGIEQKFESVLKGTDGVETVQVNSFGERTRVISSAPAEKGDDVYLTIDLELQKTAEDALERALKAIQTGGTFVSKWGNHTYSSSQVSANAQSGAVVALDVKTGDVLAMASFPDFDPNLFATGISSENWNALQSKNSRDLLSPRPLLNLALNTAVQPGSTFKPVTATAALESGLDPKRKLVDNGYIMVGNRAYNCLIWTSSHKTRTHGSVDLYRAMEVSCNYYFYDLATNTDNYKKKSLGLSKDMGIEKISKYAEQYGLGLKTGIELDEAKGSAPSAEKKMAGTKGLLRQWLTADAELYFTEETLADREQLKKNISNIADWCEENPSRSEIIRRLPDQGIREDMVNTVADKCKFDYFNQAQWTKGDELNIAIGQGENSYTPIQMANYMATLANHGVRNQVSVVKAVEGKGAIEKAAPVKMDITDDSIFDDLLEGMRRVAQESGGSARAYFASFPVDVAAKTGTAEKGGYVPPKDEVEYIRSNLSRIAPGMKWEDVEAEMNRLMAEDPDTYYNRNDAVVAAVRRVSNYKISTERINAYKSEYSPFSWFICTAPIEDPQIAVAVLLVQGRTGGNGAAVAREIIAQYLGLDETYTDYSLDTAPVQ